MTEISIGNVLMLSQVAWRTARAFTAGRQNAPYEFHEVELELSRLSKSLKLLAETLFSEDTEAIIEQASHNTQEGIYTVVQFCQHTLDYLESLVEQYQHVPKREPGSRRVVERKWSEIVLKNFNAMMWTTEGGTIRDLRNMLHMHTSTTALVRQALDSKSLERVEWIVAPIYERIQSMYRRPDRDMCENVDEIERVVESLMSQSPVISAAMDRVNSVNSDISLLNLYRSDTKASDKEMHKPKPLSRLVTTSRPSSPRRRTTDTYSPASSPGIPSGSEFAPSEPTDGGSSVGQLSPTVYRQSPMWKPPEKRVVAGRSLPTLASTPELESGRKRSASETGSMRLPPPAWNDAASTASKDGPKFSHVPTITPTVDSAKLKRSASTMSQQQTFEKELFKNSAIYCDLRGKVVEYVAPSEDENDPNAKTLESPVEDCRICIVRRRESMPNGQSCFTSSIWAFSNDMSVRFQQKLSDDKDIIPFSSYFQDEKISLTTPTQIVLHDIAFGTPPLKTVNTSWVNYVFDDVAAATTFQQTLFGNTLLASFKTDKTLRLHDGLTSRALSYQEQISGLENLRVWQDESTKAIFLMIHFSAQFRARAGYLTCYLNDKDHPVRVKDDGPKGVKIKGLRIPADESGGPAGLKRSGSGNLTETKISSKKMITGVRVEFKNESEKERFVDLVRQVQLHLVPLGGARY